MYLCVIIVTEAYYINVLSALTKLLWHNYSKWFTCVVASVSESSHLPQTILAFLIIPTILMKLFSAYIFLWFQVDSLAAGLVSLGVQRGDRVGIWSPNTLEWILTQYATARIGAILVNLNPAYQITEIEYTLKKVNFLQFLNLIFWLSLIRKDNFVFILISFYP